MSDKTSIEWCDSTWNPVTGCTEVSPGCDHCYAKTFAERWRGTPGHYFERGFDVQLRPDKLDQPLRWRKPRRIFVNSMSDLFHDDVPDDYIAKVWEVMARCPQHTFQILTKRHGRMRSLLNASTFNSPPLPNVWLGVSAENQQWADIRIPALLDTPAAVRFVSAEPLLGPIDLSRWLAPQVGQQSSGVVSLDNQVGQHRVEKGDGIGGPVNRPVAHRLPATTSDTGVVPSHIAPDLGVQPVEDFAGGAVDRDPDAASALRASSDVEVPLSVEHASDIAQHRGVSGHNDGGISSDAALPPQGDPASVQPSPDRPAANAMLGCEFVDRGTGLIGGDQLTNLGDLAQRHDPHSPIGHRQIDWLIVGGESGRSDRPMHLDWARSLRDQCVDAGVPFLFKQWGEWATDFHSGTHLLKTTGQLITRESGTMTKPYGDRSGVQDLVDRGHPGWVRVRRVGKKRAGRELDGRTWDQYPEVAHV